MDFSDFRVILENRNCEHHSKSRSRWCVLHSQNNR